MNLHLKNADRRLKMKRIICNYVLTMNHTSWINNVKCSNNVSRNKAASGDLDSSEKVKNTNYIRIILLFGIILC